MDSERYSILGLAAPRAEWFGRVAQWGATSSLPIEFTKCVSVEELRVRLASSRPYSALLIDVSLPGFDREIVSSANKSKCKVIGIETPRKAHPQNNLRLTATILETFEREELLSLLVQHCIPITSLVTKNRLSNYDEVRDQHILANVIAVCGSGGTGVSTVAAALTSALAAQPGMGGSVLLADLVRRSDQALLHDVRDVIPGVQELIEIVRKADPTREEIRALTYHIDDRGYHLLLGMRKASTWTMNSPLIFKHVINLLRSAFGTVVCDIDSDFEGEFDTGSSDIEDRNAMTRVSAEAAQVVFVVGRPSAKGLFSLLKVVNDAVYFGIETRRIVPVINCAPRSQRHRSEISLSLMKLAANFQIDLNAPVFLPPCDVDQLHHNVDTFPEVLTNPLLLAYESYSQRFEPNEITEQIPIRVQPGTIGHWNDEAIA